MNLSLVRIYEDSTIESLKKELKALDTWFSTNSMSSKSYNAEKWDANETRAGEIRKQLYQMTGDPYGETKADKAKKNVEPPGVYDQYDDPRDVPIEVYRWIQSHKALTSSDADDAVRWYRIINSADDSRYRGDITIYRAVERQYKNSEIRPGDWVTTDEKYAKEHNDRYFDGKGVILSMDVDGRDVLVSPTGNYEEAIYAPLEYSIDVKI